MSGIGAAIAILRDAYPRQEFPDRSVELYARDLHDIPDGELLEAVKRLIHRSAWLPSIAEIRHEVAEARLNLPTPEEAWEMIRAVTRPPLPREVERALSSVGGFYSVRTSEFPGRTRRDFLDAYQRIRDKAILAEQGAIPEERALGSGNGVGPADGEPQAIVRSLAARRLNGIEETTRIRPRPVLVRLTQRWRGAALPSPTDEQMHDAIEILRDGPIEGDDPLWVEAQRILDEASTA